MKKLLKRILILLAFLFLSPVCTFATDITFTSSGSIVDGNVFNLVQVQNNGTIVDMSGGQIDDLRIYNSGVFNMSGGQITYWLSTSDTSTFNLSGGQIVGDNINISVHPQSTLNIFNGTIDIGQLVMEGCVSISGGDITIDALKMYSTCVVNIFGHDFNYNPTTEILTGYLLDNNFFAIAGVNALEYAGLNLIPEPMSILLFGVGCLALRKPKK
jgi:hypothetical protein